MCQDAKKYGVVDNFFIVSIWELSITHKVNCLDFIYKKNIPRLYVEYYSEIVPIWPTNILTLLVK